MPDIQVVRETSGCIATGKGILKGLVASLAVANSMGTIIIYDSTSSTGTIIFKIEIFSSNEPFQIFFADRYAPRFSTGCYVAIDQYVIASVWATTR